MSGHRSIAAIAAAALLAATMTLVASPAGSLTVPVTCHGDDAVLEGSLSSDDALVDGVLQGLPWATAPDRSQGVMALAGIDQLDAGLAAGTQPPSVRPGASDITFLVSIELGGATAPSLPTDEIRVSDMLFELTPADGVTGAPLVGTPDDVTIQLPPTGSTGQTFTAPFDVTAAIGGEATWDLTRSEIGVSFTIPAGTVLDVEGTPIALPAAVDVQLGLSCDPGDNPIVRALVLPPEDPNGPAIYDFSVSTPEGTPVEIDLTEGIQHGPGAVTDLSSIEILVDPARGTMSDVVEGVVTYTPEAGYVGDDQFAFLACTEPYTPEPTTTTVPVDLLTRGELPPDEVVSCNAGVVTVSMEADEVPTTTTTARVDVNCDDVTRAEAQAILDEDPSDPNGLDADDDGLACESDAAQPQQVAGTFTG